MFSYLFAFSLLPDKGVSPEVKDVNQEAVGDKIIDGFTKEDRDLLERTSEKHSFDTDVSRLMDIIINSLYTHKEVFIRELISNASDACDKVRFMAIQNPDYLGEKKDLEIRIEYDQDAKTFTITDTGLGMTKTDLIKNLGTIAKSGTTTFIEAISKGSSLNLIGQFGVGFYSSYLVSNKVVVTSKHNDDNQHVWVSTAGSFFSVSEDPRGNTLGRGTRITLHLKEDAHEFSEQEVIKKNIKKYSEFINFPIYLKVNKTYTREEEIPDVEEEKKEEEVKDETKEEKKEEDLEVKDEEKKEEPKEEKKKTRTITEWKWDWELINENKPLWLRDKKEITNEEYSKFYKALSKDNEDPYAWDHGQTEGEVHYKYLIYFPSKRPYDLFENYYGKNSALKLYVRRVLVNEQFEELMPRYLNFVKGVVDSDDLPLNVSREQLQQDKMIKMMSKKLVRTAIHKMLKLAAEKDADDDEDEDEEEDSEETKEEKDTEKEQKDEKESKEKKENKFIKFYENFGKNIKLGVIEDTANRARLAKLLRFYSLKNPKDLISLDDYIAEMKEKQEDIYYIAGEEKEVLMNSPLIQKFKDKELNVLLLDDPIDEFCVQNLGEYEKKKLKNVAKGDIKFGDEDDAQKKREKKIKDSYKVLVDWWKKLLGSKVEGIKISKRLVDNPCVIVTSEYGYTANMARIQKAQAFTNQDKKDASYMYGKKTLEINPDHPSIKELRERVLKYEVPPSEVEDSALLLYETALLTSGFNIEDPNEFALRMDRVLKFNLNIDRFEKSTPFGSIYKQYNEVQLSVYNNKQTDNNFMGVTILEVEGDNPETLIS